MICPNCRKEIAEYSNFCSFCGARQAEVAAARRVGPKRLMRSSNVDHDCKRVRVRHPVLRGSVGHPATGAGAVFHSGKSHCSRSGVCIAFPLGQALPRGSILAFYFLGPLRRASNVKASSEIIPAPMVARAIAAAPRINWNSYSPKA